VRKGLSASPVKISDQKALELLESIPLEKVSNESQFLAPLHVTGRTASIVCDDVNYGKRLVAGELGTDEVWWELEYVPEANKVRVIGTVQDGASPVKVVG
jgi:hypothetical protein